MASSTYSPAASQAIVAATAGNVSPTPELHGMPNELLLIIFEEACQHNGPIKPEQWLPGYRYFAHETHYRSLGGHKIRDESSEVIPLGVSSYVSLLRTCRKFRGVINDLMLRKKKSFYSTNEFEFHDTQAAIVYFTALATASSTKMNSITKVKLSLMPMRSIVPAMACLTLCHGLQYLTIKLWACSNHFTANSKLDDLLLSPGIFSILRLRGLKEIHFEHAEDPENECLAAELEAYVTSLVTQPRPDTLDHDTARLLQLELKEAELCAELQPLVTPLPAKLEFPFCDPPMFGGDLSTPGWSNTNGVMGWRSAWGGDNVSVDTALEEDESATWNNRPLDDWELPDSYDESQAGNLVSMFSKLGRYLRGGQQDYH